MKALVFDGPRSIKCAHVPDPEILHCCDALIAVERAAVCGSDLHVYFGREEGLDHGTVMGHEFCGRIVAMGREVKNFAVGDRVICPFTTNCGDCFYCLRELTCRCEHGHLFGWVENGQGLQGVQAELVRVPHADGSLMRLPETIDLEAGLFLGDILSTGYFAAHMAKVNADGLYVVLGCGPVGLMAVIAARYQGAGRIIAVDRVPERLELARRFGAEPVNMDEVSVIDVVQRHTGGRGAEGVMDLVGSPAATRLAMDLLRPGGILSIAGVHHEPHFSFSPGEAYDKNLTLSVGRCPARAYMHRLLPLVEQHTDDLKSIISHRLPLDEGPLGYDLFANRRQGCTKVMLTP